MKKNTTKILMAALALFMAIGIATGTTFAWFAMNNTVQATGMQIKAKSNSTFLLIGESALATADQIQAQTGDDLTSETLTVADNAAAMYPSKAFGVADSGKDPASVGTAVAVENKDSAATVGNWYTANSNDPTLWGGTDVTIGATQLTAGNFSDYVIKKSVNLTLADGSTKANNLTVTPTITIKDTYNKTSDLTVQGGKTYYTLVSESFTAVADPQTANIASYYEKATDISAIKVLVVTDNDQVVVLNSASGTTNLYAAGHNANLTDTTVHHVDIYIYYDGTEAAVRSNNAVNLSGATINLVFGVTVDES